MVEKKVESQGVVKQILTKTEQDVLYLLTKEFLTIKKVAIRRGTKDKAVYKIIKSLKEKGIISMLNKKVEKNQCTFLPLRRFRNGNTPPSFPMEHQIRLHSQEFNIRILYKDQKYKDLLSKANIINIDGNTIRLYRNSIEIYSGHSFYADDVQKATSDSFNYWNRLFLILENDLKVILIKARSQNIKLVKHHYSEINNELAKECEIKADKIKVYTTDDGKLWFLIDNSFNLHEAETIHPRSAKQDMADSVRPFFNDIRDNHPAVPSEMQKMILGNAECVKSLANAPNVYTESIKALTKQIDLHLAIMQDIGRGIKEFNNTISNMPKNNINALKRPDNSSNDVIDQLFDDPVKLAYFKSLSKKEQNKKLLGGINATK